MSTLGKNFNFYNERKGSEPTSENSSSWFSKIMKGSGSTAGKDLEMGATDNGEISETTGLVGSIKSKIAKTTAAVTNKVNEQLDSGRNLTYAMYCFIAAAVLFTISFFLLPMFMIAPYKFTMLFTMGSICTLFGLGFANGPYSYLKSLFIKENITFSVAYIASICVSIYFSFFWKQYFMVIISLFLQVSL
jgi:cation transport ATPase